MYNFNINFKRLNEYVIESECGNKYLLSSLLESIDEFNKECPKEGWLLNRKNIEKAEKVTHLTKSLEYKEEKLIAKIELYEDIKDAKMKPIITTPLHFRSGVVLKILKIININLEI